jgi:hypothetical protein
MAWTAAEIPWLMACWRRIRRAHAGGPLEPLGEPPPPALDENALPEMTEETPRAAPASVPALARRVAAPATPSPPAANAVGARLRCDERGQIEELPRLQSDQLIAGLVCLEEAGG